VRRERESFLVLSCKKELLAFLIIALSLLLACQLAGEILSQALHLPIPGPVLGMVFLAVLLITRGRLGTELGQAADFLLRHLSLFFVPAAVGIIANGSRIAREWWPLGAALVVSTALGIAVTALVFQAVERLLARGRPR
jgi:holin-like protein